MDLFSLWYRPLYYVTRPHRLIEELYLKIKWFIQRGGRGYADCDVWDLDNYLAEWLPSALAQLRNNKMGHPMGMTPKSWDVRLTRMIDGFLTAKEIHEMNYRTPAEFQILKHRMDKCLKLFSYHFLSLWD